MNRVFWMGFVVGLVGLMAVGLSDVQAAQDSASALKHSRKKVISENPYVGAVVVDNATGKVLFEDKADTEAYPASVLKLMDLLIILEKIEQKQISLQDPVPVSAKASHIGGSRVWLAEKETFPVDDMLYALMVQSANDVAVALAEKVAGSTDAFVELMNKRAQELGMTHTVFHSVHGLPPGAGQEHDVTTARDLAILSRELLRHKDTLRYTSTRERPFRPDNKKHMVIMRNHDHLLGTVDGVDGLKTGYFLEAGYSISLTAERKGQRVIVIVLGSTDRKVRDNKAAELLAKGFLALPAPSSPAPSLTTTPNPVK